MENIKRVFDLLPHYKEKFPDQKVVFASKVNGQWREYGIDAILLAGIHIPLEIPGVLVQVFCWTELRWIHKKAKHHLVAQSMSDFHQ